MNRDEWLIVSDICNMNLEVSKSFIFKDFSHKQKEIYTKYCEIIKNKVECNKIYNKYKTNGVKWLTLEDDFYPEIIIENDYKITTLFYKGNIKLLKNINLGITGSRHATYYGKWACNKNIKELVNCSVTLISGIASGIEEMVHKLSYEANRPSIMILPYGFDMIKSKKLQMIINNIIDVGGLVITPFPLGGNVYKTNYLYANYLFACLANSLFVIEAGEKSGVNNTIMHAIDLGKNILALPGNINSEMSVIPNKLIRDGAISILGIEDLYLYLFKENYNKKNRDISFEDEDEENIFNLIKNGPKHIDVLCFTSKMAISKLKQIIFQLEIKEMIDEIEPNVYCAKN
jgi:DNA processing protein